MTPWLILVAALCSCLASMSQCQPATSPASGSGNGSGEYDGTLDAYINDNNNEHSLWSARGEWYNIVAWAARTSNCATNPSSVMCMACAMNRPSFAVEQGVAPIAVADALWFSPARGAVCGMCLKVYMPNGTTNGPGCPDPSRPYLYPGCPGEGTEPYLTSVSLPQNYGAKVLYDPEKQMSYFNAIIIEWFDRNQTSDYALSYPTQNTENVDQYGSWPVVYEGTPCPVGALPMEYQFLNASSQYPISTQTNQTKWLASGTSAGLPPGVGGDLCNNLSNDPCGPLGSVTQNPFGFIKLQIVGQRIPISGVDILLQDGVWHSLARSGDNYWEPSSIGFNPDGSKPVNLRIYCADGSPPLIESGIVPISMMCSYQDPACKTVPG